MDSMVAFLAMGGYGAYVWGAYGVSALALALMWWHARCRERRVLRALAASHGAGQQ